MGARTTLVEDCNVLSAEGGGQVRSILIEDGRVSRLSDEASQPAPSDALRIDAHGATVLPGLIDAHCHFTGLASARRTLDLRGASSITSVRLRLFAQAEKRRRDEWIVGWGWDQEQFSEGRFLTKEDIDDVTPQNPVLLTRICGHVGVLNSGAIDRLGLRESTTGGSPTLGRDDGGALNGVVTEGALEEARRRVPPSPGDLGDDILSAEYEAARNGITTVHCMLSDDFERELGAFTSLRSNGALGLRYRLYLPAGALPAAEEGRIPVGARAAGEDDSVGVRGVRVFADGSLGARTAALSAPYSDDPQGRGVLRYTDDELAAMLERVERLGLQAAVHAIGDAALEQTLRVFERFPRARERRWRVEHASLCPEPLRRRMKSVGVCASVQPHSAASDTWAEWRLGSRRVADLYPFASLLGEGLVVGGGSDAPAQPLSPLLGIWASMSRAELNHQQNLTLEQAVSLYTRNAAFLGFDDGRLGEVREGGEGDLVILDSDIRGIHPAMMKRVSVAATIAGGRVAYSYEGIS